MSRRNERIVVAIVVFAILAFALWKSQQQQNDISAVQDKQGVLIKDNKHLSAALKEETEQRSTHACLSSTSLRTLLGQLQPNFTAEQQAEIEKFVSTNPNCAAVSGK